MSQATNPPTLNLKLKFAENDVSFGSESTSASESECENVKKGKLTVFDVDVDESDIMSPNLIQLLKERCCILDHIIKAMELQKRCAEMKKNLQNEKTGDYVMLDKPDINIFRLLEPDIKIEMSPNLIQLLKERCCILDHIIKVMELQERCAEMKKILQNEKQETIN
jgi:hypothetical protein